MIKVIKRKTAEFARSLPVEHPQARTTVTATVNEWIDECRKNKLVDENYSRETVAVWAASSDNFTSP